MKTGIIPEQYPEPRPSPFKSALHAKCPRCRRGDMFSTAIYTFSMGGQKMNKFCPHCNLEFEIEVGYFYVAMLLSYAMNVAFMVTLAVAIFILTGSRSPWLYVVILLSVTTLAAPVTFRYSRVILLYWLTPGIKYDAELVHKLEEK